MPQFVCSYPCCSTASQVEKNIGFFANYSNIVPDSGSSSADVCLIALRGVEMETDTCLQGLSSSSSNTIYCRRAILKSLKGDACTFAYASSKQ
eukprot:1161794-Pelagomonas_calceolata.AAC.1